MSPTPTPANEAQPSVFDWALQKKAELVVSCAVDGEWVRLRSHLLRVDAQHQVLQIAYPMPGPDQAPVEISAGAELGLAFRKGHKKCIFVSPVVVRRGDEDVDGTPMDTLILRMPKQVREFQRRAYQRATVRADRLIPVKLWKGGAPGRADAENGENAGWPICSGRLVNVSLGGLLLEIREQQNPRLRTGDQVGLEVSPRPDKPPIILEGRYRHSVARPDGRIGLGFQFVGLEHEAADSSIMETLAEFVRSIRRRG